MPTSWSSTMRWLPAAAVAVALTGVPAMAQTPAPKAGDEKTVKTTTAGDKPGVVVADVTQLTATVEAVDKDKRTVTLKGPRGRTVTVKVGPEAKNFDQINVGDKVRARYIDAVAVYVRKAGAPPEADEGAAVGVAPRGNKPAAVMMDTTELTAKVKAIDYAKRTVTLEGPQGGTRTITVDPRVKRLRDVKVGDEVVVRHTEALALAVSKP